MVVNLKNQGAGFLFQRINPKEIFTPEDFTEEHRMIHKTTLDFVQKEVFPVLADLEALKEGLSKSILAKAGELGLNSTDIPEEYGGLGLDKISTAVVAEAIGTAPSFSVTHVGHTGIGTLPIVYFGNEEQKIKYLPGLANGHTMGAYALTEAGAGSDALNARTKATLSPDGRHYILNGEKVFITNAGWADLFITYAKVDGKQFTAFIIEKGFPGVSTGAEEKKMGIKGSSTRSLILEDALVPVENVLYEIGKGHLVAFNILNIGRYKLAAANLGGAKLALKDTVAYAKGRIQFGVPITFFGLVRNKLTEMALRIYFTESMVYRTAGLLEDSLSQIDKKDPLKGGKTVQAIEEYAIECSINKVYGSETLDRVVDEMVQTFGGYGYIAEYPAERRYRDARINRIFEGTNEINRVLIPGTVLKRAIKGNLPLLAQAQELMVQTPHLSAPSAPLPGTPLDQEGLLIESAKKLTVFTLGIASQKLMDKLPVEQEVLGVLSEMIIEVFAMESGWLRARKIIEKEGLEKAEIPITMVQTYLSEVMGRMELWARTILAYVVQSEEYQTYLSILKNFIPFIPVNTIALRKKISAKIIGAGEYALFWGD